jgi:8-oxo-dGTP diphosphatase
VGDLPKHSVSVAGVVTDQDGRVLIVQRRDNAHWEPPGGVLELTETPEEGVIREVLEETGVQIRVNNLSGVYKNMRRGVIALVFRCEAIGGNPRPTIESLTVEWVQPEEVQNRMAPAYAIRVLDAYSENLASRAHDGHNLYEE